MKAKLPASAHVSLFASAALVFIAGCASTPKPPQQVVSENLIERSATVSAVDTRRRMLTLATADGEKAEVMLDPTVKNIDRIEVGDKVVVSYYQGIAAELKKPGEGVEGVEAAIGTGEADPGEKPGGAIGTQIRTTVSVMSVDKKAHTITVRLADGSYRTLDVVKPKGQEFIAQLQSGDQVEVSYTEAIAVQVRPAD